MAVERLWTNVEVGSFQNAALTNGNLVRGRGVDFFAKECLAKICLEIQAISQLEARKSTNQDGGSKPGSAPTNNSQEFTSKSAVPTATTSSQPFPQPPQASAAA